MLDLKLPNRFPALWYPLCLVLLSVPCVVQAGSVKAKVQAIIDKLPEDKEQKMQGFADAVQEYIEDVEWLEEDDRMPLELSIQLFLSESLSNVEDRYNCEFLISSSDVQYFDRRVRFPFEPTDLLVYSEQSVEPLTGVLNFYINMVLGSEMDKVRGMGGDIYYKRALNFGALGKFVRTEFSAGWTQRVELINRVFRKPFMRFREMKDYYFYGLYVLEEENNKKDARANFISALDIIEEVMETKGNLMEEPQQFLNSHYTEIVDLFKDYSHRDDVFKKLIKLDPDHRDIYEKHITDS